MHVCGGPIFILLLLASIIRVTRIGELETTLAVTSNQRNLEEVRTSETWVFIRATGSNISEDGTLHSHRRENLKSHIALASWAV
jgi:hypothetical protein